MDATTCIKTRRSIRAFKKYPVPRDILTEVIATAQWSPSYKNSQPWEVAVISGAVKESLTQRLIGLLESDAAPTPDLPAPGPWPPAEAARIAALFQRRREETGIDLTDPRVVRKSKKANFAFYGAPHVIYLYQEATLSPWSLFDLGLFAQSLMLAAHAQGLGTVPQAFVTDYAREIKEHLGIARAKRLVLGFSIGYPDEQAPINQLGTGREDTATIVRWLEG